MTIAIRFIVMEETADLIPGLRVVSEFDAIANELGIGYDVVKPKGGCWNRGYGAFFLPAAQMEDCAEFMAGWNAARVKFEDDCEIERSMTDDKYNLWRV